MFLILSIRFQQNAQMKHIYLGLTSKSKITAPYHFQYKKTLFLMKYALPKSKEGWDVDLSERFASWYMHWTECPEQDITCWGLGIGMVSHVLFFCFVVCYFFFRTGSSRPLTPDRKRGNGWRPKVSPTYCNFYPGVRICYLHFIQIGKASITGKMSYGTPESRTGTKVR